MERGCWVESQGDRLLALSKCIARELAENICKGSPSAHSEEERLAGPHPMYGRAEEEDLDSSA